MRLTDEQKHARKMRNLALAGILVVFIVILYFITILKWVRHFLYDVSE